ncbi:hypothetical protein BC828DRAFT_400025 [Blastocladiella britannica]|nr:hypothetical protein BC828DRAFT_400025 [Blastocladiella britannica]
MREPSPLPSAPIPHAMLSETSSSSARRPHAPVHEPLHTTAAAAAAAAQAQAPLAMPRIHASLTPPKYPSTVDFSDDDDDDRRTGSRHGRGRAGRAYQHAGSRAQTPSPDRDRIDISWQSRDSGGDSDPRAGGSSSTNLISAQALALLESNLKLKASRVLSLQAPRGPLSIHSPIPTSRQEAPRLLLPFPHRRRGTDTSRKGAPSPKKELGSSHGRNSARRLFSRPKTAASPVSLQVSCADDTSNSWTDPEQQQQADVRKPPTVPLPLPRPSSAAAAAAASAANQNDKGGQQNQSPFLSPEAALNASLRVKSTDFATLGTSFAQSIHPASRAQSATVRRKSSSMPGLLDGNNSKPARRPISALQPKPRFTTAIVQPLVLQDMSASLVEPVAPTPPTLATASARSPARVASARPLRGNQRGAAEPPQRQQLETRILRKISRPAVPASSLSRSPTPAGPTGLSASSSNKPLGLDAQMPPSQPLPLAATAMPAPHPGMMGIDEQSLVDSVTRLTMELDTRLVHVGVAPRPSVYLAQLDGPRRGPGYVRNGGGGGGGGAWLSKSAAGSFANLHGPHLHRQQHPLATAAIDAAATTVARDGSKRRCIEY